MSAGALLIVPECERGRGGGHLSRSFFLLAELLERGRDAYLWIPRNLLDDVILRFGDFFESLQQRRSPDGAGLRPEKILSAREELFCRKWDFIVLDRFRTPPDEFAFWRELAPLIGIDEGGPCRKSFDFLIDLLPGLNGKGAASPNLVSPALLPLPEKRRPVFRGNAADASAETQLRVLISFGAEDAAGLGLAAARALAGKAAEARIEAAERKGARKREKAGALPLDISLIAPLPLKDDSLAELRTRGGVRVMVRLPELKERLAEYDLFISHFGLGAFEAVYARLPVLLASPTAYHEKLGRNAGFFTLGCGSKAARRLAGLDIRVNSDFFEALRRRSEEIARRFGLENDKRENLGAFVNGFMLFAPRNCPVCGEKAGNHDGFPVLARFPEETYRRCPRCGTIYLARLRPPPIEYEKEYFFDFYKQQYGKTYIEDFPKLMEMGRKRLTHICSLLNFPGRTAGDKSGVGSKPKKRRKSGAGGDKSDTGDKPGTDSKPRLLDIGCAYGPFLAAAAEYGFSPAGVEPAEDAVRYVKEELRLPVRRGFFPDALRDVLPADGGETAAGNEGAGTYAAVTLWYVVEHFEKTGQVLEEINRLLKDGGVLAFSTPSYSGISGRKSLRSFLEKSPPDHFTVWKPRSCKKIFRQYGFRLKKIVISGHHPERFPLLGRFADPAKKGFLYRLLLRASRLFRLGDTFEAYGVKRASCNALRSGLPLPPEGKSNASPYFARPDLR